MQIARAAGRSPASIEYGPLQPGELQALADLYRRVLDAPARVLELYRWQERIAPPGLQHHVYVARHRGRLVGAMTAVPVEIRGGGRSMAGAWQQDSAVSPDFRRRGIAAGLLETAAAGFEFVMTKGTSRAMARVRRAAGFVDVSPSDFMVRVLRPRGGSHPVLHSSAFLLSRLRARSGSPYAGDAQHIDALDERFDALDAERAERPVMAVRRSAAALRARYRAMPGRDYRILALLEPDRVAGAVVLRPPTRPGAAAWLVDWIRGRPDSALDDRLLGAAISEARALGAGLLAVFASDPGARASLGRRGFLRTHRSPRFLVRAQSERAARLVSELGLDVWHGDGDLEMIEEPEGGACKTD